MLESNTKRRAKRKKGGFLSHEEENVSVPTVNCGHLRTNGKTPLKKGKTHSVEVKARISEGVRRRNRERLQKQKLMTILKKTKTRLGPSAIHGVGVIATRTIGRGEPVFLFNDMDGVSYLSPEEVSTLPEAVGKLIRSHFLLSDDEKCHPVPNAGIDDACGTSFHINSCKYIRGVKANVSFDFLSEDESGYNTIVATREIKPGEELLLDYDFEEGTNEGYPGCHSNSFARFRYLDKNKNEIWLDGKVCEYYSIEQRRRMGEDANKEITRGMYRYEIPHNDCHYEIENEDDGVDYFSEDDSTVRIGEKMPLDDNVSEDDFRLALERLGLSKGSIESRRLVMSFLSSTTCTTTKSTEVKHKNGKKKAKGKKKRKVDKPKQPKSKANKRTPKFPVTAGSMKDANGGAANSNSPAVKKAWSKDDVKYMAQSEPYSFVGRRVSKYFDGECFFGKITKYDDTEVPPFWHVAYDDGDEEDLSSHDLIKALEHYEKHGKDDTKHLTR